MKWSSIKRKKIVVCADCKNCKLMVWQNDDNEDDKLDDLAKNRGYIIKDKPLKAYYMVRCQWTKDTVFQPHKLVKCEGKQEKQGFSGGDDE